MSLSRLSASLSWLKRVVTPSLSAGSDSKPTHSSSDVLFPPHFLASIERLRLAALKSIGGGLSEGHRLGSYKGGQLEFHGHRNYVLGDELRYIDWNSYARLGKPYIKEFAREEAGVVHLMLDATASMALGSPSKWTFARRLAALFSHVALASKDQVEIHVFKSTQQASDIFPWRGRKAVIRQYLDFLERLKLTTNAPVVSFAAPIATNANAPQTPTGSVLSSAVDRFLRTQPKRGRVILIGDFWFSEQEILGSLTRLAGAGFDVSVIHVLAPEEIHPDLEGNLVVRSLEDDSEVELQAASDLSERYSSELGHHQRLIETAVQRRGGLYLMEPSDTHIEHTLISTLQQRRWVTG